MMYRFLPLLAFLGCLFAQRPPVESAWDLLAKGQRAQAIDVLRTILKTHPADADAHLLLGSVLAEEGDRDGSFAQLREAVRLRPQSAEAHNALGEAYNRFDRTKLAKEAFEKAIRCDPKFVPAQQSLGLILLQAGDFPGAARHLDQTLQLLGNNPDAAYPHYLRAKVNTEQNEISKAALHLSAAVALRPDFAEAWSDLGQARKTLLDDAGALAAFERAVAAGPDDQVAQYRLGAEYAHQGQPHLAVLHLRKALTLNPEDQSALYVLQTALRQDGQPEEAKKAKEQLAELLQKRDQAAQAALVAVQLNNEGAELEKKGDLPGALNKYKAALELSPDHVGFRVNLAAALLRLGQWRQGIAELREALRREPDNAKIQTALDTAIAHAPREP